MNDNSITNLAGKTLRMGQEVTHYEGWKGTVTGINDERGIVYVTPHNPGELREMDFYPLNDMHRERTGRDDFCKPRDHGLTMGNFLEAQEDSSVWPTVLPFIEEGQ